MTTVLPAPIRDPWQRAWRFLSGDRWLTVLLFVQAALLLAAALLPQTPQTDPVAYSRWLSETQQRFGTLTTPLTSLGLFAVTQSIAFRLITALLALNGALRLIDTLGQLRALRRWPDRPARPTFDRVVEIDRAAAQAQLRGWRFQTDNEVIVADHHQRRSLIAVSVLYAGWLAVAAGLVLATFTDSRTENIVVEPGTVTPVPGTPYTVRLDALTAGRATVALLQDGQAIGQGELADRQPLSAGGVALYLRRTGPALIVTARRGTQALGLQSIVDSPPQSEKLLSFAADRSEAFVAAPQADIVLQLAWLSDERYTAQALQMATGKVLASSEIAPGQSLTAGDVTFATQPAAYITVAAVRQPAHWLILPGWVLINLSIIGLILWRASRVWLEAQAEQTRVICADDQIAAAVLKLVGDHPISPLRPTVARVAATLWLIWTVGLVVMVAQVYPGAASLEAAHFRSTAWLAAWLGLTGSVCVSNRIARVVLMIGGVAAAAVAIGLWLI